MQLRDDSSERKDDEESEECECEPADGVLQLHSSFGVRMSIDYAAGEEEGRETDICVVDEIDGEC